MKGALAWLLFLLLPAATLADGKVIPAAAFPATVTIPDQRALIHFTNGTERLVIETRFTGHGTNFAWVIPLPSQPVVEEASRGLFPTLSYLFRPRITHNVTGYYRGILILMGIVYLLGFVQPGKRLNAVDIAACLLVAACTGVNQPLIGLITFGLLIIPVLWIRLLKRPPPSIALVGTIVFLLAIYWLALAPSLSKAGMSSESSDQAVSILDRRLIGVFETVTISSQDPQALQRWLAESGFSVPTNAGPVIERYVKQGWVFVAAKVQRDDPSRQTSTPHPLSFTFKTDRPVYPMRLTGVHNGPLQVELYVFGPGRATAPHFRVERCAKPAYPPMPEPRDRGWWGRQSPALSILHPMLRSWVLGSSVATRLSATLSPEEMRDDVWLRWEPFAEEHRAIFSNAAARTIAFNLGSGVLGLGLIGAILLSRRNEIQKRMLPVHIRVVVITALLSATAIFVSLPKTEVRVTRHPGLHTLDALYELCTSLSDAPTPPPDGYDAEIQRLLTNATKGVTPTHSAALSPSPGWNNELLGGQIRQEDSPGNFLLRESGNFVQFVVFDAYGAEVVLDSWYLPGRP